LSGCCFHRSSAEGVEKKCSKGISPLKKEHRN